MFSLLTKLTHKNVKFEKMDACEKSFQELKEWLVIVLILTIQEGEEICVIYYDAFGQGLEEIFMQHGRVIAYAYQKLQE